MVLYDIGGVRQPRRRRHHRRRRSSPSALFVPGVGGGLRVRHRRVHRLRVRRDLQRGVPQPAGAPSPGPRSSRVAFTGLFYALSAWAMIVTVGPANLQARPPRTARVWSSARSPSTGAPVVADIANVLFLTSVFAALLSFHNGVARYLFALGREQVLPAGLSRVGTPLGRARRRLAGPVALAVVVVLAVLRCRARDPVLQLFTWLQRHVRGRRRAADGGHVGRGRRLLPAADPRRRRSGSGSSPPRWRRSSLLALVAADRRQLRRAAGHRPDVAAALGPARARAARGRRWARGARSCGPGRPESTAASDAPRWRRKTRSRSPCRPSPPTGNDRARATVPPLRRSRGSEERTCAGGWPTSGIRSARRSCCTSRGGR